MPLNADGRAVPSLPAHAHQCPRCEAWWQHAPWPACLAQQRAVCDACKAPREAEQPVYYFRPPGVA